MQGRQLGVALLALGAFLLVATIWLPPAFLTTTESDEFGERRQETVTIPSPLVWLGLAIALLGALYVARILPRPRAPTPRDSDDDTKTP